MLYVLTLWPVFCTPVGLPSAAIDSDFWASLRLDPHDSDVILRTLCIHHQSLCLLLCACQLLHWKVTLIATTAGQSSSWRMRSGAGPSYICLLKLRKRWLKPLVGYREDWAKHSFHMTSQCYQSCPRLTRPQLWIESCSQRQIQSDLCSTGAGSWVWWQSCGQLVEVFEDHPKLTFDSGNYACCYLFCMPWIRTGSRWLCQFFHTTGLVMTTASGLRPTSILHDRCSWLFGNDGSEQCRSRFTLEHWEDRLHLLILFFFIRPRCTTFSHVPCFVFVSEFWPPGYWLGQGRLLGLVFAFLQQGKILNLLPAIHSVPFFFRSMKKHNSKKTLPISVRCPHTFSWSWSPKV